MPAPTANPAHSLESLADALGALLERYAAGYERLLACLREQHEALRRADGPGVERAARSQAQAVADLADLEHQRGPLVNAAAATLPELAGPRLAPVTLSDVARALPGATALRARAGRVREMALQAHRLSGVVSGATRSLLGHAEGLLRGLAQRSSHSGTYGPRGLVAAGGAVTTSLDLRT